MSTPLSSNAFDNSADVRALKLFFSLLGAPRFYDSSHIFLIAVAEPQGYLLSSKSMFVQKRLPPLKS